MKKIYVVLAIFLSLNSTAQAKDQELLVAGDSWAMFMCLYSSFSEVLIDHGYFAKVNGCNGATRFGGRADEWATYPANTVMISDLKKDTAITTVYLSMGGNDFFAHWNTSLSPSQEQVVFEKYCQWNKIHSRWNF